MPVEAVRGSWLQAVLRVHVALLVVLVLSAVVAVLPLFLGDKNALADAPRFYRFTLVERNDGSGRPEPLVTELRSLLPQARVTLEGSSPSGLRIRGPRSAVDFQLVVGLLSKYGYRLEEFRTGPDFGAGAWARFLSQRRGLLAWFLGGSSLFFLAAGLVLRARTAGAGSPEHLSALRAVGGGAGIGLALFLAAAGVQEALAALDLPVSEQPWISALAKGPQAGALALALLGVVLAPVAEEVFFRGWVFAYLRPRAGRVSAYALSAVLFGLVHFNPSSLPIYLLFGLGLAWIYDRTRRLVAPITAHATINALALAMLRWAGGG